MNVLVIEDCEDLRFLLAELLPLQADVGEMRLAANWSEVVDQLGDFEPDVAILDSLTGGPPPQHTAGLLRRLHPNVRIISFSGMQGQDTSWADAALVKSGAGIGRLAAALTSTPLAG